MIAFKSIKLNKAIWKRREVTKESFCRTPFKRSSARVGKGDLIHDFKCDLQVKLKNVVRIYL